MTNLKQGIGEKFLQCLNITGRDGPPEFKSIIPEASIWLIGFLFIQPAKAE